MHVFPLKACVLAVAALAAASSAHAAKFTAFDDAPGSAHVLLEGVIAPGDAERLEAVVDSEAKAGRRVTALSLHSPGGDIWEGFQVAQVMRRTGMASAVEGRNSCNSSCFTLFAVGRRKFVSPGAVLVVHRPALASGDNPALRSATLDVAVLYRSIGVPNSVIGGMVTTPHTQGYLLDAAALAAMGAVVTPDGRPAGGWDLPTAPPAGNAPGVDAGIARLASLDEVRTRVDPGLVVGLIGAGLVLLGAALATFVIFVGTILKRAVKAREDRALMTMSRKAGLI